jgi:TonB-dependent receptor
VLSYQIDKDQTIRFLPTMLEQLERKRKEKATYNKATGLLTGKTMEFENKDINLDRYGMEWERRYDGGALLKMSALYSQNTEEKDKRADQYNAALVFTKSSFEDELKRDRDVVLTADYSKTFTNIWSADHIVSFGVKHREKDRAQQKTTYDINNVGVKTITTKPEDSYSLKENVSAVYFMDEAILSDRLTILPGVRMEHTAGSYITGAGVSGSGNYTDWNPSIHTTYKMGNGYQLRASMAKTIARQPFKEMVPTEKIDTSKGTIERGNPNLKPARAKNYDVAIEKFFGKSGFVSLGAFYKDIKDTIEKQDVGIDGGTGYVIKQSVNVGNSKTTGVELEVKTGLEFLGWKNFTLTGSYTHFDSEVLDTATGIMRGIVDQPENVATMVLKYENKRSGWAASIGMNYVGEKVNAQDPAKVKVEDAFTQWDASVTKTLSNGTQLFVSVVNLLNEKKVKNEPNKTEVENTGRSYYIGMKREI